MTKPHFCLFFFFNFSISSLFAQEPNTDSILYRLAAQNVVSLYNKTLEENIHLYNGTEYIEDHPGIIGSPYWKSPLLQTGSIHYDGIFYPDIPLAYDIVKDELIIRNQQQLSIKLVPEKIDYFILFNQLFIHIAGDSINNAGFQPGVYNILNTGAVSVFAKRRKTSLRVLQPTDHYEFREQDTYFIRKDEKYYAIDSKSALFNALRDKNQQIKKFFQKNKFNFKKDLENTIIKTIDYYNLLIK
ncbi:MAG: hypothetical protein ABJA71_02890 [Ginsengibacter sp.]